MQKNGAKKEQRGSESAVTRRGPARVTADFEAGQDCFHPDGPRLRACRRVPVQSGESPAGESREAATLPNASALLYYLSSPFHPRATRAVVPCKAYGSPRTGGGRAYLPRGPSHFWNE